jgi:hypothetical protein
MRLFSHFTILSSTDDILQHTRNSLRLRVDVCVFVLYGPPSQKKVIAGRVKLVKVDSHLIVNSLFGQSVLKEKMNSNELHFPSNILLPEEIVMNLLIC